MKWIQSAALLDTASGNTRWGGGGFTPYMYQCEVLIYIQNKKMNKKKSKNKYNYKYYAEISRTLPY